MLAACVFESSMPCQHPTVVPECTMDFRVLLYAACVNYSFGQFGSKAGVEQIFDVEQILTYKTFINCNVLRSSSWDLVLYLF